MSRFELAIVAIDAANALDPQRVEVQGLPAELVYGRRMTGWLERMYPDAMEALRLAARAQHIRRWEIPRNSYPMDRAGYHRWRTALYGFHADMAEGILRGVGYDESTINRVRALLKKERLKADPETQALEDVACLVFLEFYFAEFAVKHPEEKVIGILRRTWAKMSDIGRAAAMKLEFGETLGAVVRRAISG